ncbi:hypothetical protein VCR31J2_2260043 [Vibrio coralliirubri]|uniref:Polysaccharide pyruvyl transferase domain-containing protein n=1 Tax=Vibrio coralliirubri TaxID=1516159 RepID=A0AA87C3Q4_9VIBR|nr:polysaccharide pyruvyl transferase family protein [Vibrio coralliirubri]CDU10776.1 hypothetical protein VCR31J2_2260043 [Vibrio coralliirubri]
MNNAFLIGWFGRRNFGDDLLFINVIDILEKSGIKRVVFFVDDYNNIPKIDTTVKLEPILFKQKFKGQLLIKTLLQTVKSQVLIFGGGSMFSDNDKGRFRSLRLKNVQLTLAKLLGIKTCSIASGLGPVTTREGHSLFERLIPKIGAIQVRDKASLDIVEQYKSKEQLVYKSYDPAIRLVTDMENNGALIKDSDTINIGVSFAASRGSNYIDRESFISDLFASVKQLQSALLKNQKITISLIQMCDRDENNDLDLMGELIDNSLIETRILYYTTNTISYIDKFRNFDYVIAERLHASIIAYSLNIPFLVLPYHSKCLDFCEAVSEGFIYPQKSIKDFFLENRSTKKYQIEDKASLITETNQYIVEYLRNE